MATFTPSTSNRPQPYSWASIVSGQPNRSGASGIRGVQRSGSGTSGSVGNLTETPSQRYSSNALNLQAKIAQLPTSVPSYLEDSCYSEKLSSVRPPPFSSLSGPSIGSSTGGATTTAAPTRNQSTTSLASLSKTSSSRPTGVGGLKLDVEKTVQPKDDDLPTPLPTKWNEADKSGGIEISQDGLDVRFLGPNKVNEYDSAAARADHFMPRSCGVYYFEVTIMNKSREGLIGIGFCGKGVPLNRLPGWEPDSWGYHGDDGKSFCCSGTGKPYGPQFNTNDVIGCGINFRTNSAFFTRNGNPLGTAFKDIGRGPLYPAVGMKKPGEHIRVNFGQEPFEFDIDDYARNERLKAFEEISATPVDGLCPPLDEAALIQSLISSYLHHDGFVETAKAFASDLEAIQAALSSGRPEPTKPIELLEDRHAINRQTIRTAILDGDIDLALHLTQKHYPKVLAVNPHIEFRLRCRKFIEMMRVCADHTESNISTATTTPIKKGKVPVNRSGANKFGGRGIEEEDEEDTLMGGTGDNAPHNNKNKNTNNGSFKNNKRQRDYDDLLEDNEEEYEEDDDFDDHDLEYDSDPDAEDDDDEEAAVNSQLAQENSGYNHQESLLKALEYSRKLQDDFKDQPDTRKYMEEAFSLFAYIDPRKSPVAHLLEDDARIPVAEELNSAILVSLGKSPRAPLERLFQQTTVLLRELSDEGGNAAFVNLHSWVSSPDHLALS